MCWSASFSTVLQKANLNLRNHRVKKKHYIKTSFQNLGAAKYQEIKGTFQESEANYIINGNAKSPFICLKPVYKEGSGVDNQF